MLTGPLFMLQVYDRVLGSRSEETLVALLILVVALFGLMWLLDFARTRLLARYGARLQAALDGMVFRAELQSPVRTHAAARGLDAVQSLFGSSVLAALMDLPFTPIFIAVIFVFHPLLGFFALGGGLSLVLLTAINRQLTNSRVAGAEAMSEETRRFAENAIGAAELIRSQGMLDPVTERWLDGRSRALRQSMRAVDWTSAFETFTRAFRLALQSLVLALGAWLVLRSEITAGAMVASSVLLGRALAPIEQIVGRWPQIARAQSGWRALVALLDTASEMPPRTRLPRPDGRLDVASVTLTTGPGHPPLLYNITFSLDPGEALGVIGKSGSGKTTIAKVLLGLIEPGIGEVRLGGALISHYAHADLGRHVGYLPQDPVLITGTIAENIARMARRPASEDVVAAARKAKVHDLILSLPDGYDTRIEDNAIALSGGQRQRIALARALFGDPMLLVLDEPNSALDQEGSEALNAAVRQMKSEGRSVVIMTHRPVAISECDKLMVVEGGRITALGPRDEVLRTMIRNADDITRTIRTGTGT
jgi:ATP-binding cassette subfamily C protein